MTFTGGRPRRLSAARLVGPGDAEGHAAADRRPAQRGVRAAVQRSEVRRVPRQAGGGCRADLAGGVRGLRQAGPRARGEPAQARQHAGHRSTSRRNSARSLIRQRPRRPQRADLRSRSSCAASAQAAAPARRDPRPMSRKRAIVAAIITSAARRRAVVAFHRDAEAELRQRAAEHALGAGLHEHARAERAA